MLRIRAEKIGLRGAAADVSVNGESFELARRRNVASFLVEWEFDGRSYEFRMPRSYFASFMNEREREREREREAGGGESDRSS